MLEKLPASKAAGPVASWVRITAGPLAGLEGAVVGKQELDRLLISPVSTQGHPFRGAYVAVDAACVESIELPPAAGGDRGVSELRGPQCGR